MRNRVVWGGLCAGALILATMAGCGTKQAPPDAPANPVVPVSHPTVREVTDYVEYTGRTDAVQSVGIRARVTGYMVRSPFKEGDIVKGPTKWFGIVVRPGELL